MNWFQKFITKLEGINQDVVLPTTEAVAKDLPLAAPFTAIAITNVGILDDILGATAAGLAKLNPAAPPTTADIITAASPAMLAVIASPAAIPAGHVISDQAAYKAGALLIAQGRAQMLAALTAK